MNTFLLFIFIIAVCFMMIYTKQNTVEHFQQFPEIIPDPNETIFVSLASYRDKKCPTTINSLYSNAARPYNIYVGLCQQNDGSKDIDCAVNNVVDQRYRNNIRTIRLNYFDAKGPTWARYLCSTLLQDETYYFQIDSHCLFSKDWDIKLIDMIKKLKASGVKKPLLSHYMKSDDLYGKPEDDKTKVPAICRSFFNDQKMISFEGAEDIEYKEGELPMPNPYSAAGMIFGESKFVKEVPYDPNLPYLFVGEEILHSIRLWTHGWDIFTPTENIIYHYYTREKEDKIWTDVTYTDDDAVNKVRVLLDLEDAKEISPYLNKNLEIYGLGKERTLQQYLQFAGIDKKNRKINRDFCRDKNIRQVWDEYKNQSL